jgi:hypothetical protein
MSDIQRALNFMKQRGTRGAISEDFEFNLIGQNGKPMTHQTGTALWNTMWKKGLIVPTGEIRPTRLNNPAKVHVLPEFLPHIKRRGSADLFSSPPAR